MKVIFIGSDRSIFEEGSAARARMVEYGKLFDEIHIVIFVKNKFQAPNNKCQINSKSEIQIGENVWVYPTNSWCRWMYPFDAARIARGIIAKCRARIRSVGAGFSPLGIRTPNAEGWVVSAQDPFESGLAAEWAARNNDAKLHIQIHTDFLSPFFKKQSLLNRLRLLVADKVLPRADGIRVVSPRIKNSLDSKFKIKDSKITILPIFVDKEKFANVAPYDFKKDNPNWAFMILSVGRLEPEKNFWLAIKTLKIVCRKYPRTGLAIIGAGRERNKLERFADSLGLSKNVSFVGEQKDLRLFYRGADIYLQTSNFEGFGMAAVEAGYAGLPVVMTDVGIAGWLLKDGKNSKICPVLDEKCLAVAITNLMEDNGLRERLRGELLADFGKELPGSKTDYLEKYKKSIEK